MQHRFILITALVGSSIFIAPGAMATPRYFPGQEHKGDHKDKDRCDRIEVRDLVLKDKGTKLSVSGELECLKRDKDVDITLEAVGKVVTACLNPGGQAPKPHQPDPFVREFEGEDYIPEEYIEKGMAEFKVVTEPLSLTGRRCKPNWTEVVKDVRFFKAKITIEQGSQTKVIKCTFDPSSDGKIKDADCE